MISSDPISADPMCPFPSAADERARLGGAPQLFHLLSARWKSCFPLAFHPEGCFPREKVFGGKQTNKHMVHGETNVFHLLSTRSVAFRREMRSVGKKQSAGSDATCAHQIAPLEDHGAAAEVHRRGARVRAYACANRVAARA